MDTGSKMIKRGKGWHNTGTTVASANYGGVEYEGMVREFSDMIVPTDPNQPWQRRSGGKVTCVLVRNVSGIALQPGLLVSWKAGYRGRRIGGYAYEANSECAGVVDEFWPSSGVPDGELFWLVVKGHTICKTGATAAAANVITAGAKIKVLTGSAATGTTTNADGRITPANTTFSVTETTDGTAINVLTNFVGVATSAASSAADQSVLVELDTHWRG